MWSNGTRDDGNRHISIILENLTNKNLNLGCKENVCNGELSEMFLDNDHSIYHNHTVPRAKLFSEEMG